MLFLEFTHVEADHGGLGGEERNSASLRESSVFPTSVGPRKKNEARGLSSLLSIFRSLLQCYVIGRPRQI